MFTDVTYDMFLNFLNLWLRLRSTAKGRSFLWPNIRLRPKGKNVATVQHCSLSNELIYFKPCLTFFLSRSKLSNIGVMTFFNILMDALQDRIFGNGVNSGLLDHTKPAISCTLCLAEIYCSWS